jgi:3-oxoadipate enol-lactonase
VLRYDARGHGASSTPAGEYSLDELGGDALALLDALAIERTHVCGLSLGGLTAQWLAVHAGARVEGLVLSNTAARIGTSERWQERMDQVAAHGLEAWRQPSLERWFTAAFRAREPALVEAFGQRLLASDRAGYVGCCAALRDGDLRAELAAIRAETLVVVGTYDLAATPADGHALASGIASARLLELPVAHLANVEAAAAFTASLSDFLLTRGG